MSKKAILLEITPPEYGKKTETEHSKGHKCPKCNERGGDVEQTGRDEYKINPCDYCGGSGQVNAEIAITWKPAYEIKTENNARTLTFPGFGFTNYISAIENAINETDQVEIEDIHVDFILFTIKEDLQEEDFINLIGRMMVTLITLRHARLQRL